MTTKFSRSGCVLLMIRTGTRCWKRCISPIRIPYRFLDPGFKSGHWANGTAFRSIPVFDGGVTTNCLDLSPLSIPRVRKSLTKSSGRPDGITWKKASAAQLEARTVRTPKLVCPFRRWIAPEKERKSRKLVFFDCQLPGSEGKMKGSTKSPKMDEPFNM